VSFLVNSTIPEEVAQIENVVSFVMQLSHISECNTSSSQIDRIDQVQKSVDV